MGTDVVVGAEVVKFLHWPSLSGVLEFHEYAGPLPLGVDKSVDVRAVRVLLLPLVVEHAYSRVPGRGVVLGVVPDYEANNTRGEEIRITTDESKVPVYVIPTDEEVMIARDAYNLCK